MNQKEGRYLIGVISIGFEKAYSQVLNINNQNKEVPAITMLSSKMNLADVTVQSVRPFIEMHLDKMVINVEASPTNAGANVLEVLAKSPAVIVDMDENVSLNGKQGVMILIDGKKTYLAGKELSSLLKSMAASNIDQIEIMNNPPAKYEAEGMAGIINIKTKKNKNDGWNGSFSVGTRVSIFTLNHDTYFPFTSQNSINFNYKKGRLNLFGSAGFSRYAGRNMSTYD